MADADTDETTDDTPAPEPTPEPERLHGATVVRASGQVVLHADRGDLLKLVTKLRDDGYWQCVDVCGVDYLTHPGRTDLPADVEAQRLEVVVSLVNHRERSRVRIRVQVPEDDPTVPSLFRLHPGTEAPEREVYDLFGITFDGHPDMSRILLPDEWVGHPLRKDHAIGRVPVQFKQDVPGNTAVTT